MEIKTQQGGPVRSRKSSERNYNHYIEERTRSEHRIARRGGDQQRKDQERKGASTSLSIYLEVFPFVNPTPLAHADTQRDIPSRGKDYHKVTKLFGAAEQALVSGTCILMMPTADIHTALTGGAHRFQPFLSRGEGRPLMAWYSRTLNPSNQSALPHRVLEVVSSSLQSMPNRLREVIKRYCEALKSLRRRSGRVELQVQSMRVPLCYDPMEKLGNGGVDSAGHLNEL
ncbi:uncharacterized protein TNCV_2455051 [Trichonephila clavipes]|nr:uncharacterized protein TNCV_2455051 [Trichonephila clavipes]